MKSDLRVEKTIEIRADSSTVWEALTKSKWIQKYMYGYSVETDWKPGSSVTRRTNAGGKEFIRKGRVLSAEAERLLKFTDYNPEVDSGTTTSHHAIVTYELSESGGSSLLKVIDDAAGDKKKHDESEKFWSAVLPKLKEVLEK